MYEVEELFAGVACKTRVWITNEATDVFEDYMSGEQPKGKFIKKLRRYAETGFPVFEGGPIRHEWRSVYRIGEDLFRLIGFYESDTMKSDFIVIDAFKKRGKKLSAPERGRIDEVARTREKKDWKRKEHDGKDSKSPQGSGGV